MKLHKNGLWLRKRYVEDKKSVEEIAKEAGVSTRTIYRELKKLGLV